MNNNAWGTLMIRGSYFLSFHAIVGKMGAGNGMAEEKSVTDTRAETLKFSVKIARFGTIGGVTRSQSMFLC